MRISLKTLAIFWVLLLAIIGGLLYNAYSKFKADAFIAVLTEQVQKNYPGAKLNVGKIAYKFSLDFNLKLQDVYLRRSGKLLGSIKEIELKVPWWLLVVNKGNARINVSDLDVFVDQDEVPKITEVTPEDTAVATEVVKISVPSYFAETRFTLRAKNIAIRDINSTRRFFTISKLLVREFQYGKNTAFEVNVPIEINLKKSKYRSELWLFGDVTPEVNEWKLNFRGEFRTREINDRSQLEDLVINGNMNFLPTSLSLNSSIDLQHEKESIGKGTVVANQDHLTINLDFKKLPLSYLSSLYEVSKNPYLVIPQGEALGKLSYQKHFETNKANVSSELEFEGPINLSLGNELPGKWKVTIQNKNWEVSFNSQKNDVFFSRKSLVDLSTNETKNYQEELLFTGLELENSISAVSSISAFLKDSSAFDYSTVVNFKKCYIGEEVYDGSFKYGRSETEKFYQAELRSEKSSMDLKLMSKNGKNNFEFKSNRLPWAVTYNFLTPYFSADSGLVTAQLQGEWNASWESGLWRFKFQGEELMNEKGYLPDFFEKTFGYFEQNVRDSSKINLDGYVKNNVVNITALAQNEVKEDVKITGNLSSKQKSQLEFFLGKRKTKPVVKEIIEPYWMQKEEQ